MDKSNVTDSKQDASSEKDDNNLYWESGWSCWQTFNVEFGNVEVDDSDKPALARWVRQQRENYQLYTAGKVSELSEEIIARMNEKGFVWVPVASSESHVSAASVTVVVDNNKNFSKKPTSSASSSKPEEKVFAPSVYETTETLGIARVEESTAKQEEAHPRPRPETPEMEKMQSYESALHQPNFALESDEKDEDMIEDEENETESDEEERGSADHKPQAQSQKTSTPGKKTLAPNNKRKQPPGAVDVAQAKAVATSEGRYPKRKRRTLSEGDAAYFLSDDDDQQEEAKKHKVFSTAGASAASISEKAADGSTVYSVMKVSEKTGKKELRNYEIRNLRRLVEEAQEGEVREQIRVEFADLLVCEEPLEPNKQGGIDHQTAKSNIVWEKNFLEYLVFKKVYGHGIVPKVFVQNPALGRWTIRNRRWWKVKDKRLTGSRYRRLSQVDFVWEAKKDPTFWMIQQKTTQEADKWEAKFKMLLDYKEENGDCLVPKEHGTNMVLARWVGDQRKQMKAKADGKPSILTDDREQRLRDIGFVFNTRTREHLRNSVLIRFQDRWNDCFQRLLQFKEQFGHAAVPRRWKSDKDLASWAMRQRSHGKKFMKGEDSYLTPERFDLLKSVEFVFDMDRNKYPMDGTQALKNTPVSEATAAGVAAVEAMEIEVVAEMDSSSKAAEAPRTSPEELAALAVDAEVITAAIAAGEAEQLKEEQEQMLEQNAARMKDFKPASVTSSTEIPPTEIPPTEIRTVPVPNEYVEETAATARTTRSNIKNGGSEPRSARASRQRKNSETSAPVSIPKVYTNQSPPSQSSRQTRQSRKSMVPSSPPTPKRTTRQTKKPAPLESSPVEVDSMRRTRHSKKNVIDSVSDPSKGEKKRDKTDESFADEKRKDAKLVETIANVEKNETVNVPVSIEVFTETVVSSVVSIYDVREGKDESIPEGDKDGSGELVHESSQAEESKDQTDEAGPIEDKPAVGIGEIEQVDSKTEIEKDGSKTKDIVEVEGEPKVEEPPPTEPTPEELEKRAMEKLLKTNKGKWICENCGKDEHLNYVSSLAHESMCFGLAALAIPVDVALD